VFRDPDRARRHGPRSAILTFEGRLSRRRALFPQGRRTAQLPIPTFTATYNDADGVEAKIKAHAHEAAVIVEPMMGGGGCLPADRDFLFALRQACSEHNVVLIFDEVMTSRLSTGGYQAMVASRRT
jgi:glutamate-1-semialdehyde 2,1-aminomutase